MTTEQAYKKAMRLLEKANDIWDKKIVSRYSDAQKFYDQALEIYQEYFSDNKKVLTNDLCPF